MRVLYNRAYSTFASYIQCIFCTMLTVVGYIVRSANYIWSAQICNVLLVWLILALFSECT